MPSLRMPPLIQPWMPAIRRALRSQKTVSSPKPARKNSADHLVPTARPRQTPAASRHQRIPSQGPDGQLEQAGAVRPGRPRPAGRAAPRAGAGRRRGPSAGRRTRRGSRTSGRCPAARSGTSPGGGRPRPAARPATAPRVSERKSFWAIRASRKMDRVPVRAAPKRQPKGLSGPKSHMPAAIIHLPDRRVDDVLGGVQQHPGVAGDEGVVGLVRPGPLVAADQERVAVLDVVGLVEDQVAG